MTSLTPKHQDLINERFLLACENADMYLLHDALSEGADVESRNQAGETALHLAVKSGNSEIVSFLIHQHRLNPDLRDTFGRTALHWAAQQGNVPIVEVLLLAHASIGAKDDMGVEPKIYAEMAGHRELVKIFTLVRGSRKN